MLLTSFHRWKLPHEFGCRTVPSTSLKRCRGLQLAWCPGSYEWTDPYADVLPPSPHEIRKHVNAMRLSYEEAVVRQKPYNCAQNEPDTVQQATLRGEHVIWCHGHKTFENSDTQKTGPPSKNEIAAV